MKHSPPLPEPGSKIAVVGASARAAAFSLLRAGYQVVAADLFADADLARRCEVTQVSPYPDGFEAWLADTECDAWNYTGALENRADLVDRLSVLRPLHGHGADILRPVRDPLRLQNVLDRQGIRFPKTVLAGGPQVPPRHITKTCGGGEREMYWQQFVEGISLSAVFRGAQLLGVTRQLVGESWAGAGQFQYCGTVTPWPLAEQKLSALKQIGQVLRDEFGLSNLFGVDLIDDGAQLWVLEVNPRYTASMEVVERSQALSVFGIARAASPATSHDATCYGKVVLFAKAPLWVSAKLSETLLQQAGDLPWPTIADIPNAGTKIETGHPILTLFSEGSSCEDVTSRLRERVEAMEQQLYGRNFECD